MNVKLNKMIKLYFITNYGNEKAIRNALKENNIEVIGESYHSGLYGCDSPYILNIQSNRDTVLSILEKYNLPDSIFDIRI